MSDVSVKRVTKNHRDHETDPGVRLVVRVEKSLAAAVDAQAATLAADGVRHTRSDVVRMALIAFLNQGGRS